MRTHIYQLRPPTHSYQTRIDTDRTLEVLLVAYVLLTKGHSAGMYYTIVVGFSIQGACCLGCCAAGVAGWTLVRTVFAGSTLSSCDAARSLSPANLFWSPGIGDPSSLGWYMTLRVQGPKNRVLGSTYYKIDGIWALKPCYLCPWTLRVKDYQAPGSTSRLLELPPSHSLPHRLRCDLENPEPPPYQLFYFSLWRLSCLCVLDFYGLATPNWNLLAHLRKPM